MNRAKNIDPDNPRVYEILGEIYRDRNDIESSLAAFKMVLFLKPWSQFAEQTVQQLESVASSKTADDKPFSTIEGDPYSFSRIFKERKIKKLQKLLAHIEKVIATTATN